MIDNNSRWQAGDPVPPACEPCKDHREEREYDLALGDPNRCFGRGIEDDPLVVWVDRTDSFDRSWIWAHNNFAKGIAKWLGFTHSWIIKAVHNKQYARDAEGRKILIGPKKYLLKPADMHITLRLGTDLYGCRLSAHAYVVLDECGNPEKYMTEAVRSLWQGGSPQLEFWRWQSYHRRSLPERPVDLGPDWELHANVGPYLDTYRPNKRWACDTYTPRSDDTPPRYDSGYDTDGTDDEIEGARTPELAARIQKCHAAYDVYKAFHERLVAMDEPTQEGLVELYAMQEQIATMKRDIYREAKGIIA
ncbi:hypothetical protein F4777DRAFT_592216 [Nemania sp. FL0916]|nr:hypothetical protein F4777DRAFT_592216 [Nemania sp. FL0916]